MTEKVTHVLLKGGVMLHIVGDRETVGSLLRTTTRFCRLTADWNGKDTPIDLNVDQVLLVESDHERGEEPVRSQDGTAQPVPYLGNSII